MDAVGEEVPATAQHQDRGRSGAGSAVGVQQPSALVGAHRPAGEGEPQEPRRAVLAVADVRPRPTGVGRLERGRHLGQRREPVAQGEGGGELEGRRAARSASLPQLRDPHRAVHGRSTDRPGPGGQQVAGASPQFVLRMTAVQEPLLIEQFVQHAGLGIGRAQFAKHHRRAVGAPVDPPHALVQVRPGAVRNVPARTMLRAWDMGAVGHPLHREQDGLQRGVRDLAPVQVGLGDRRQGTLGGGPDGAAVHHVIRLQHRHPPGFGTLLDRPVQGGGPTVAERPRVDDQTGVRRPDVPGHGCLQHRRHDQLRLEPAYRLAQRLLPRCHVHVRLQRVAALAQFREDALGEAVERARKKQDPHVDLRAHRACPAQPGTERSSPSTARAHPGHAVRSPGRPIGRAPPLPTVPARPGCALRWSTERRPAPISALTGLVAGVLLIDHEGTSATADHLGSRLVLQGTQRSTCLHRFILSSAVPVNTVECPLLPFGAPSRPAPRSQPLQSLTTW